MPIYTPIDCGHNWHGDSADLSFIDWTNGEFEWHVAGEPPKVVRVKFTGDIIVRILDEFALSMETSPDEWIGAKPHHFAYEVDGDEFFSLQSEVWRRVNPRAQHFRFLTGAACVDVISSSAPKISVTLSHH